MGLAADRDIVDGARIQVVRQGGGHLQAQFEQPVETDHLDHRGSRVDGALLQVPLGDGGLHRGLRGAGGIEAEGPRPLQSTRLLEGFEVQLAQHLILLTQASQRAWRLGKQGEVRIFYLAYAGTVSHDKLKQLASQGGAAATQSLALSWPKGEP